MVGGTGITGLAERGECEWEVRVTVGLARDPSPALADRASCTLFLLVPLTMCAPFGRHDFMVATMVEGPFISSMAACRLRRFSRERSNFLRVRILCLAILVSRPGFGAEAGGLPVHGCFPLDRLVEAP